MNGKILKKLALFLGMVVFLECFGVNSSELAFAKSHTTSATKKIDYKVVGLVAGVPLIPLGIWGIGKLFGAAPSNESIENDELTVDRANVSIMRLPPHNVDAEYINRIISDDRNVNIEDITVIPTGAGTSYDGITDQKLLSRIKYGKVAIIDAANTGGLGGGGVDGAIFEAMGGDDQAGLKKVQDDLTKMLPVVKGGNVRILEGSAVIHSSYDIGKRHKNVPYVIQTVSPRLKDESDLVLFYSAWYNAVALGVKYECDALVTAAIGMGVFCENRSPEFAKKCAKVALQAINDAKGSRNIRIVLTDHRDNRRNEYFFDELRKIIINV